MRGKTRTQGGRGRKPLALQVVLMAKLIGHQEISLHLELNWKRSVQSQQGRVPEPLLFQSEVEADKECEGPLATWVQFLTPSIDNPGYTEIAFGVYLFTSLRKASQPGSF
jgi:hypothetical protein